MADDDLPEGFTLDQTGSSELPEGFVIDKPSEYNGTGTGPWSPTDPNSAHAKANKFLMDQAPGLMHTLGAAVQGVPVVGALNGELPGQEKFNEENPVTSGAANLAGGIAATAPLAGAIAAKTLGKGANEAYSLGEEYAPNAFNGVKDTTQNAYGGIKNLISQSGLFGGLGGADAAVKGGNEQDINNKAILGALGGASGPVLSKVISPGVDIGDKAAKTLSAVLGTALGAKVAGLGESVLGLLLGEHDLPAQAVKKYAANTALKSPNTQALLSTLGGQAGQVNSNNTGQQ